MYSLFQPIPILQVAGKSTDKAAFLTLLNDIYTAKVLREKFSIDSSAAMFANLRICVPCKTICTG